MTQWNDIVREGPITGHTDEQFEHAARILAAAIEDGRVAHYRELDREIAELGFVWGLRGRYWLWWSPFQAQQAPDRIAADGDPF
jgi:hypothetical protein